MAAAFGEACHRDRAVYVISVAAELAGMHPQTLRLYERRGLLGPSRTIGGSRRYSEVDLDRLRSIQQLTDAGLNLAGVSLVLELQHELEELRQGLAQTHAEIEALHREYRRDLVPLNQLHAVLNWHHR